MSGFVYLVGAGPGDPRLLTMRAHELVRTAEVLAHDELVPPAILDLAPDDAERIAVGRRAGAGPTSYRIHPEVLARARAGRHVVRLKCGDPLVFGRGGEEAEALAEAGIETELVPGISAALGAAAYAGIPLTHRDAASSVRFATGHTADAPRGETLVVYMAGRRLAATLAGLERAPTTPAAWIAAATTPDQHVITGTVADLAARVADAATDPRAPALLIVGEVVARRRAWWAQRPLAGRTVLVARARPGRSRLAAALRALGAQVAEAPAIDIARVVGPALGALDRAAAIGFGCAAGVDAVLDERRLPPVPVVAIGEAAARALARRGVVPALALPGACRDALSPLVGAGPLVVVTAVGGRPSLVRELTGLGVAVEAVPTYREVPRMPPLPAAIDLVVLPSSSAARLVLTAERALADLPAVAIGARTEEAARALGARRVVRARHDSLEAVVATVREVA